jgi:hypothetical protein
MLLCTICERTQMNIKVNFKGNMAKRHACACNNICRMAYAITVCTPAGAQNNIQIPFLTSQFIANCIQANISLTCLKVPVLYLPLLSCFWGYLSMVQAWAKFWMTWDAKTPCPPSQPCLWGTTVGTSCYI